ncbi:MAG: hypothetical protein V2A79_19570 [Planctomycetota bacterium]
MDPENIDLAGFEQWQQTRRRRKRRLVFIAFSCILLPSVVISGILLKRHEASKSAAHHSSTGPDASGEPQALLTQPERDQPPAIQPRLEQLPTPELSMILGWEALGGSSEWSLSVQFQDQHYPLMTPEVAVSALQGSQFDSEQQARELAPYTQAITALMSDMKLFGKSRTGYLPRGGKAPVLYGVWQGKRCILLSRLASDTVYNTRQLTSKQRAAAFLQSHLLPCLPDLDRHLFDTTVPYYGIAGFFGSKEFGEEYASIDAEGVCIIVSRTDCRSFVQGLLTQDQLVRQSAVFMTNRDHIGQFVRVEVVLE